MLGYHGARPRLLRPVSGLLLDMGDVIHDTTVWRPWLARVLGRTGLLGPRANLKDFFRVWDREYLGDVHRGRREFDEAFRALLVSFGLTPAQVDEVHRACHTRRRRLEADAQPLPGVRATLCATRRGGIRAGRLERLGTPGPRPRRTTRTFRTRRHVRVGDFLAGPGPNDARAGRLSPVAPGDEAPRGARRRSSATTRPGCPARPNSGCERSPSTTIGTPRPTSTLRDSRNCWTWSAPGRRTGPPAKEGAT